MEFNLTLTVKVRARSKEEAEEIRKELPDCLRVARVDDCVVKCIAGPLRRIRRPKRKKEITVDYCPGCRQPYPQCRKMRP